MQINQPKSVKLIMREHKSRSGVNWRGALNRKGVKQISIKQGHDVYKLKHNQNVPVEE
jgi:hypothetical protein